MIANLIDFFKKQDWIYSTSRTPDIFTLSLSGYDGTYYCITEIDEEQRRFVFISFIGLRCPIAKMKDMAELLNRINSNLSYGNFEMNPTGDIKFRTGTFFEDTELTEKAINNVIFRNINTIDASIQLLSKFMVGDISTKDVYEGLYHPKSLLESNTEPEE